jgi:hypothetical protein
MKLFDWGEETLPRLITFCFMAAITMAVVATLIAFVSFCLAFYYVLTNWM